MGIVMRGFKVVYKERVYNAVGSGYISESEYKLITGEDYK